MNIRISAIREIEDPRTPTARSHPRRENLADPLDPRAECPLGRMSLRGQITLAEYEAGCRWRSIYHNWLQSIGAPSPFPAAIDWGGSHSEGQAPLSLVSDELEEEREMAIAKAFKVGESTLKKLGVRVFHAVNAITVYEEPEELGDFEFTAMAAKRGLAALAQVL